MTALPLTALLVASLSLQQGKFDTDTTVAVPAGTRLSLQSMQGDVVVRTWDRNQVRIQATHSSRTRIEARVSESVLRLEADGKSGMGQWGGVVDYELTVPAAMAVELQGMGGDVRVEGTRGDISVNTIEGDVTVQGGGGTLTLATVNGAIRVTGARGRVEARAVSDDVELVDVQGDVTAETVSGDLTLLRVDARRLEAQTVSGDVRFDGAIRPDGSYSLLTHSGDVTVAVPEGASATVRTAVSSGDVSASFGLPEPERASRSRKTYRLGTGSATVELETFSGDIHLVRPGDIKPRRTSKPEEETR
ncbi:MAG TPA: DUF4097 family beta strand repeat-containing protein [Gemmatimonadales bacterium]